ncbi:MULTISPECIES: universal stress protein [Oceanimonas]|uniref:Universal stress protein n=1 Tax=Oceanimonas doudoroffii TaxID=84158 RepID=A0A233RH95_9GAMM|nr:MULTISPECIES: universal stress protein [Oceanimonas]NHI00636.1 Universal stress protein A [Oceanimonas sp. MB9]OXY82770.1 universal stress global response regulator UspA [Oceanimonas doudoroffii]
MPYRNILVALELNHREKPLLKRAADLAESYQAALHLVHVEPDLSGVYVGSLSMDLRQLKMKLRLESGHELMRLLRTQQHHVASVSLPSGDVRQAVRLAVRETGADLLICGHRPDHRFWGHLFSNSVSFLDISDCDLLVVKLDPVTSDKNPAHAKNPA